MCSNDNVTQVLPQVTVESKQNAVREELQRMKAPVNQNQISNSLIYSMLQFTFPLNGTARVEVAGCQLLQYLTRGVFLPLLLKHFSQSFSLSRDEHPVLSGTKVHWCSSCNMENNQISYKVSEKGGFIQLPVSLSRNQTALLGHLFMAGSVFSSLLSGLFYPVSKQNEVWQPRHPHLPHLPQTAHSIFPDVLVGVVEIQQLQSLPGQQLGPDLQEGLELVQKQGDR